MSDDRNLNTKQGRRDRGPKERLVALIIGVSYQCHTSGNEFRTRGDDGDIVTPHAVESHLVIGGGLFAVFQLCLGYCGTKSDVPQGGSIRTIGLAPLQVLQEGALGDRLRVVINRAVGQRPVNTQPERAPQILKLFLVLDRELFAELDEVASTNRDLITGLGTICGGASFQRRNEAGLVGKRGIASNAVVVLNSTFGGETVVVPSHGVEDVFAPHALVARL